MGKRKNATCRYCGNTKANGAVIGHKGACRQCGIERTTAGIVLAKALYEGDVETIAEARAILDRRVTSLRVRGGPYVPTPRQTHADVPNDNETASTPTRKRTAKSRPAD